uniref:Uncharacterized protein n=1 Tax=Equus caballus TaxID=9796 RepID=A0A9L0SJZ2_HORSE
VSSDSPRLAPDENAFPFALYPVCQDPSEPRALCCTTCPSEKMRNGEDQSCPKCREDDSQSISPESLLVEENICKSYI